MKLHRLGRTSFRAVKSKRDYLRHCSSYNWLYLSRLAALKEFGFMKALEEHGFPVSTAVDCNRDCVIMSLVQGYLLYFDREVECIFKVFRRRFNLSFQETRDGDDSSDVDAHESVGSSFSSISKTAGFLDKELAASGFTRKDQDDIEKFIGGNEKDSDDVNASELNETNVNGVDSSHLLEQNVILKKPTLSSKKESVSEEKCQDCEAGIEIEPDGHLSDEPLYFHSFREDDNQTANENDTKLMKRIEKQRRHAVAAACGA